MELFYSKDISVGGCSLDGQESNHCIKVLRHRRGDIINVIDGVGNLYKCEIVDDSPKALGFKVIECVEGYGSHPYRLHVAVAPPKNIDRFEWFAEKATEIGIDEITPIFGDYSERKVFKKDRAERIIVSAAKQSHKGAIPSLNDAITVREFILKHSDMTAEIMDSATAEGRTEDEPLKLICYCDEVESLGYAPKRPVTEMVRGAKSIIVMIGPEGDFSRSEVELALKNGWHAVSLGESRLRIETAALTAVSSVYLANI